MHISVNNYPLSIKYKTYCKQFKVFSFRLHLIFIFYTFRNVRIINTEVIQTTFVFDSMKIFLRSSSRFHDSSSILRSFKLAHSGIEYGNSIGISTAADNLKLCKNSHLSKLYARNIFKFDHLAVK